MAYASKLCETCEHKHEECYCAPNSVCSTYKEEHVLIGIFEELNVESHFDKVCIAALVFEEIFLNVDAVQYSHSLGTVREKLIEGICEEYQFGIIRSMAHRDRSYLEYLISKKLNLDDYVLNMSIAKYVRHNINRFGLYLDELS